MFFLLVSTFMQHYLPSLIVFQAERPILLKEVQSKLYGVCPYFLTRVLVEMPLTLIVPLLFTALVYFAIGFTTSVTHFFEFYLVIELLA